MKRNPPLLELLTTAVEISALGLGAWITSWHAAPTQATEPASAAPTQAEVPIPVPEPVQSAEAAPPAGPILVAPPPSGQPPSFLAERADARSRFLRGFLNGRWVTFAFYSDDAVRFVDVDGACYEGLTVNAVAVMREHGGEGSFTLQITISPEARLQATFLGGKHDAETLGLEPLVERPVA